MTATADAKSVVQSFYANLAKGRPQAIFAPRSDDIEPYADTAQLARLA